MHSLVDFCMCPDWGSNPQPWRITMTPLPTELPGQGSLIYFIKSIYCGPNVSRNVCTHDLSQKAKKQWVIKAFIFCYYLIKKKIFLFKRYHNHYGLVGSEVSEVRWPTSCVHSSIRGEKKCVQEIPPPTVNCRNKTDASESAHSFSEPQ